MSPFDVEERALADLQTELAAGRIGSADLVSLYVERIERIDRAGPRWPA